MLGALLACKAVREAVARWPGTSSGADPADLVRPVESLWRLRVAPKKPADCATTCRFALREPSGTLLAAGLGDGMTLISESGEETRLIGGREPGDFANETLALGVHHQLRHWQVASLKPGVDRCVVLATDGIADDLRPEKFADFVHWLRDRFAHLPPGPRWARLRSELSRWPVPHHSDDKTLAVMIETENKE